MKGRSVMALLLMLAGEAGLAAQYCNPDLPREAPDGRFVDYEDGTVADKRTGLVWKRCLEGVSGAHCENGTPTQMIWQDALAVSAGSGWRLPNIKELASILDRSCTTPAVNQQLFPGNRETTVWSATPVASETRDVWIMDLYHPINNTAFMNESHALWLVRDPADSP